MLIKSYSTSVTETKTLEPNSVLSNICMDANLLSL